MRSVVVVVVEEELFAFLPQCYAFVDLLSVVHLKNAFAFCDGSICGIVVEVVTFTLTKVKIIDAHRYRMLDSSSLCHHHPPFSFFSILSIRVHLYLWRLEERLAILETILGRRIVLHRKFDAENGRLGLNRVLERLVGRGGRNDDGGCNRPTCLMRRFHGLLSVADVGDQGQALS